MIEPRLYGQILGMFRRLARGEGNAIMLSLDDPSKAELVQLNTWRQRHRVLDPMPIEADIRPILDGSGVPHPDPVMVVNAKARSPLWHAPEDVEGHQRNTEPGVRFVVNGSSFAGPEMSVDGRCWWGSFDEAVEAARKFQREHPVGSIPGGFARVFVDLRQSHRYAPFNGTALGSDTPLLSWEIFQDRTVMSVVGGVTTQQREEALALEQRGKVGFA